MTIALIYGGKSSEHEVSLVSAAGVLLQLMALPGYDVLLIGVTRSGLWFQQDLALQAKHAHSTGSLTVDTSTPAVVVLPGKGIAAAGTSLTPLQTDCVFPVLHGSFGEDGTVQGLLEMAGLPYVGSGVVGSSVGMDKIRSKQLWDHAGIPIVPYIGLYRTADTPIRTQAQETAGRISDTFGFPVFVKPNAAGSSVGISRVADPLKLAAALERAFTVDSVVLIEQAINAREIETAVLGNPGSTVRAFPPGEVIPTHEFYDYTAKYEDPDGARLAVPADLTEDQSREIQRLAVNAFIAVDGAGFARVDCFLNREGGTVFVNEINTIPGFTPISMYPKMVQNGGMSYGELLQELIRLGMERGQSKTNMDFSAR